MFLDCYLISSPDRDGAVKGNFLFFFPIKLSVVLVFLLKFRYIKPRHFYFQKNLFLRNKNKELKSALKTKDKVIRKLYKTTKSNFFDVKKLGKNEKKSKKNVRTRDQSSLKL